MPELKIYKRTIDLELGDEGIYQGELYKISGIKVLVRDKVAINIYNNNRTIEDLPANLITVEESSTYKRGYEDGLKDALDA